MITFCTSLRASCISFFFFNDTATTEIYTLSLHDALPISAYSSTFDETIRRDHVKRLMAEDRKSTRLNSSHHSSSYAVFCLKKKTAAFWNPRPTISQPHTPPRKGV